MSPQTPDPGDMPLSFCSRGALMTDSIFVFVNAPRQRRWIAVEKTLASTTENNHVVSESELPSKKVFVAFRGEPEPNTVKTSMCSLTADVCGTYSEGSDKGTSLYCMGKCLLRHGCSYISSVFPFIYHYLPSLCTEGNNSQRSQLKLDHMPLNIALFVCRSRQEFPDLLTQTKPSNGCMRSTCRLSIVVHRASFSFNKEEPYIVQHRVEENQARPAQVMSSWGIRTFHHLHPDDSWRSHLKQLLKILTIIWFCTIHVVQVDFCACTGTSMFLWMCVSNADFLCI